MKCKHDWVRSGYGNDLICNICGYTAAQATLTVPSISLVQQPVLREKMEVPLCVGEKTVRVSVYRDDIEKELYRAFNANFMAGA